MADMTGDHYKEIEKFANELPSLRTQASDRGLLDLCQQYLSELLELSKDIAPASEAVQ